MRTSHTHPLQIASVEAGSGRGRIGITFCPGKRQPSAMTGGWNRDVGLDLDAVHQFGAAALVTLIEQHEIESLGVEELGNGTLARHMQWCMGRGCARDCAMGSTSLCTAKEVWGEQG